MLKLLLHLMGSVLQFNSSLTLGINIINSPSYFLFHILFFKTLYSHSQLNLPNLDYVDMPQALKQFLSNLDANLLNEWPDRSSCQVRTDDTVNKVPRNVYSSINFPELQELQYQELLNKKTFCFLIFISLFLLRTAL